MDRIGILVGTAATAAVAAVAGYAMLRRSKQAYTLLKDLPPGVEDFKGSSTLGPFQGARDVVKRAKCWLKVLLEYPRLVATFEEHSKNGWFQYGTPPATFADLGNHSATAELLSLRQHLQFKSTLEFQADHAVLPTYLPIEEGAAAAVGSVALAAAELFELRTGRAQRCVVSQSGAGLTTAQYLFIYVQPTGQWGGLHGFDGTMAAEGTVKPQRKAYECKDGRWIFLHGGFPKLKKGLTDFLECKCSVPEMAAACKKWNALELETAMQAKGLAATMCRTPMEWRASEQGRAIEQLPPIVMEPLRYLDGADMLAAGGPRLLASKAARPLSDILVVDFSHVIASPVVGRTLVDHGATVIKVISHERPRREMFDCETNHGKRTLCVELSTEAGRQKLWDLLKVADVLIDGFANQALSRKGFGMAEVLQRNPHLVYLDLTCFGHVGPLSHGKGFQQNANFAAGVAGIEDEELLGYQLVSQIDYCTGYMGAYAVILGLIERQQAALKGKATAGVVVHTSLCQAATWMAKLGARAPSRLDWLCRVTRLLWFSDRRSETVADLTYIPPSAAVRMSITPPRRHGFERWWPDDAPTDDLVVAPAK